MKKIYFLAIALILALGLSVPAAFAAEPAADEEAYVFPSLAPEGSLFAGYRHVDLSGSTGAAEYEYLKNSLLLGGEYRFFNFPHRFHLDFDMKNVKDYFGDLDYSYEDIVVARGVFRGLHHNLDNIVMTDLDPLNTATSSPTVLLRDANQQYGINFNMSTVSLRFKTHDFPFHLYIDGSYITKNGQKQERFLLGSGAGNPIIRTSQARDVDWTTRNIVVGVNSHLGPIEVDLSHGEKRFEANGTNVFFDSYSAVTGASPRAAGVYPHNLIPDQKGSSNTLKVHTSYTGGLVASMTLSQYSNENQYSGAKADYLIGAGDLVWIIRPGLQTYLKYRHREISIDTPETVTLTSLSDITKSYTYAVDRSLSSIEDKVIAGIKYNPLKGVMLRAEYTYDDIRRNNAENIFVNRDTQKQIFTLASDVRLAKGLNLRAKYEHKEANNPAYNIDPGRSDEATVTATWVPLPFMSATLNYSVAKERRHDLNWLLDGEIFQTENRSLNKDRLIGSVTVSPLRNFSVTGSYAYMHNKTQQDMFYENAAGTTVEPSMPFKNMVQSYSLEALYTPAQNINLSGGVTHTISSGAFYPVAQDFLQPISIASLSAMKMHETVYSLNGDYSFKRGFKLGVQYRYSKLNDVLANPYDEITNGKVQVVLLTLSKKW